MNTAHRLSRRRSRTERSDLVFPWILARTPRQAGPPIPSSLVRAFQKKSRQNFYSLWTLPPPHHIPLNAQIARNVGSFWKCSVMYARPVGKIRLMITMLQVRAPQKQHSQVQYHRPRQKAKLAISHQSTHQSTYTVLKNLQVRPRV